MGANAIICMRREHVMNVVLHSSHDAVRQAVCTSSAQQVPSWCRGAVALDCDFCP